MTKTTPAAFLIFAALLSACGGNGGGNGLPDATLDTRGDGDGLDLPDAGGGDSGADLIGDPAPDQPCSDCEGEVDLGLAGDADLSIDQREGDALDADGDPMDLSDANADAAELADPGDLADLTDVGLDRDAVGDEFPLDGDADVPDGSDATSDAEAGRDPFPGEPDVLDLSREPDFVEDTADVEVDLATCTDDDADGRCQEIDCDDSDPYNWTAGGCALCNDRDADGVYARCDAYDPDLWPGPDCDGTDPMIWQLLPGYRDRDGDHFGSGSELDVCSGSVLPMAYASEGGDCADATASAAQRRASQGINPGAVEIPWREADEDCAGDGSLVLDDSTAIFVDSPVAVLAGASPVGGSPPLGSMDNPYSDLADALIAAADAEKVVVIAGGASVGSYWGSFESRVPLFGGYCHDRDLGTWTHDPATCRSWLRQPGGATETAVLLASDSDAFPRIAFDGLGIENNAAASAGIDLSTGAGESVRLSDLAFEVRSPDPSHYAAISLGDADTTNVYVTGILWTNDNNGGGQTLSLVTGMAGRLLATDLTLVNGTNPEFSPSEVDAIHLQVHDARIEGMWADLRSGIASGSPVAGSGPPTYTTISGIDLRDIDTSPVRAAVEGNTLNLSGTERVTAVSVAGISGRAEIRANRLEVAAHTGLVVLAAAAPPPAIACDALVVSGVDVRVDGNVAIAEADGFAGGFATYADAIVIANNAITATAGIDARALAFDGGHLHFTQNSVGSYALESPVAGTTGTADLACFFTVADDIDRVFIVDNLCELGASTGSRIGLDAAGVHHAAFYLYSDHFQPADLTLTNGVSTADDLDACGWEACAESAGTSYGESQAFEILGARPFVLPSTGPCVDTAVDPGTVTGGVRTTRDVDGQVRPDGSTGLYDIGADEYVD